MFDSIEVKKTGAAGGTVEDDFVIEVRNFHRLAAVGAVHKSSIKEEFAGSKEKWHKYPLQINTR